MKTELAHNMLARAAKVSANNAIARYHSGGISLGSFDDFCDYVIDRIHLHYPRHGSFDTGVSIGHRNFACIVWHSHDPWDHETIDIHDTYVYGILEGYRDKFNSIKSS